jgi:hypothetical protein
MQPPHIPNDDLMDVMEMTSKIESYIANVIKDTDQNIALSSLMNGLVNSIIEQCKTYSDVIVCRNLLIQVLDISIRSIQWKKPEPPSS